MIFKLSTPTARENALRAVQEAPEGYVVQIGEETRTQAQNRKLWPLIRDVREQTHLGEHNPDQVKLIFMNAYENEMRFLPSLDGGQFVVGQRSSLLNKRQFSDLLEVIQAWAAKNDVKWSERAWQVISEYSA